MALVDVNAANGLTPFWGGTDVDELLPARLSLCTELADECDPFNCASVMVPVKVGETDLGVDDVKPG